MKTITTEEFDAIEFDFEVRDITREVSTTPYFEQVGFNELKSCTLYHSFVSGVVVAKFEDLHLEFSWRSEATAHTAPATDAIEFDGIRIDTDVPFVLNFEIVDDYGVASGGFLETLIEEKMAGGEWESRLELSEAE